MVFQLISDLTKVPLDQVQTFLILILICPSLSYISFRFVPKILRPYLNISTGIWILNKVIGFRQYHIMIVALLSFTLLKVFKNKCLILGQIIFFLNFFYLTMLHLERYINCNECWGIDITNCMMIAITKITAFSYSYLDNYKDFKQLKSFNQNNKQYLIDINEQEIRKISEKTNLIEYLEYVYFFPTLLAGPFFDFYDMQCMIKREKQPQLPLIKELILLLQALGFFGMIVIVEKMIGYNNNYVLSDEFKESSVFYKLMIILTFGNIYAKSRYYGALKAVELSVINCGLSWDDQTQKYDRIVISDIAAIEFNHNPKEIANKWNQSVASWLKRNVYARLSLILNYKYPGLATLLTFALSALWHGVHPSKFNNTFNFIYYIILSSYFLFNQAYYLFFTMFFMIQTIGKNFYINWYLFQNIPKFLRILFSWLFTFITVAYFGYSFNLLTIEKTLKFFDNFGYWPIINLIFVFIVSTQLKIINPQRKINQQKKD